MGVNAEKHQAELRLEMIHRTTQTRPSDATHWSCRTMAQDVSTSPSFVHRVWKSAGLKLHLIKTFKVSNDPRFEEKYKMWSDCI